MSIQVLKQEEINEVSGGLLVQVGANATTPILALDLNLTNLLATVVAVVDGVLGTVGAILTGVVGTVGAVTTLLGGLI